MLKKPWEILLVLIIAISVLVSIIMGWQRVALERANRQLELALEYSEVERLSRWAGMETGEVLRLFQEKGVSGVLFKEDNLADLATRQVWVKTGTELLAEREGIGDLSVEIKSDYTYILTRNEEMGEGLRWQIDLKGGPARLLEAEGVYLVETRLNQAELKVFGLGFDQEGLALAREAGLNILLQVQSWPQASPEKVGELFSHLRQEEGLAALLFNDGILPGYPDSLPVLVESVRQLDVPVGIIEFFPQAGLESLVQSLGKKAVRLHAISDKEMAGKMTPGRGVERFTLAAAERNNRILLARFFFKPEIGDLLTYNLDYMGSLGSALRNQGFTFGPAVPYDSFPVSRLLLFLMGLGVIAGGVFLCNWLMPARWALTLGVLGVLGWLVILAIGRVDGGRLLMALGAVVIYPTLSVASGLRKEGVGPGRSIYLLVRTSLFSLIGAVLLVGLLADVGFMLKIEQFRGVKAAHVLPLILLVIILLVREEGKNWLKNVVEWFQAKISVGWALLASVLALALVVYVMRTGNEAAVVSGLELEIRSWLDRILLVRPRTKEFLIGHPLLVLSFYLGYRHRYLPLALLGAIGQVSLVNTFAHVHTPLGVSFFRAFNGLWLGLLLGAALIMVYRLVVAWGKKVFHGE